MAGEWFFCTTDVIASPFRLAEGYLIATQLAICILTLPICHQPLIHRTDTGFQIPESVVAVPALPALVTQASHL
jgi:hypothetical protein